MAKEISGLAVHDRRLRKIKSDHATAWRQYLEAYFERAQPTGDLSPRDAARVIHALVVGLDTNTLFDRGLSRGAAQDLFRGALRNLSGLPATASPPARRVRAASRKQPSVTRRIEEAR